MSTDGRHIDRDREEAVHPPADEAWPVSLEEGVDERGRSGGAQDEQSSEQEHHDDDWQKPPAASASREVEQFAEEAGVLLLFADFSEVVFEFVLVFLGHARDLLQR